MSNRGSSALDRRRCLDEISLVIIVLTRSSRLGREAVSHEAQLLAAREVQQVLLPPEDLVTPGLTVEAVYLPAQQVGGDFYQVLPVETGVFVIVGDVAGKGLAAAMMVSVLVGAVRALTAFLHQPAVVLAQLNELITGHAAGGFTTACAAYIASDGATEIASAGHLNPYLNGSEIELPGALPLGLISGATYSGVQFHLAAESRLTFYSDGVIEAQNSNGALMGFERGRELSTLSAALIGEAARNFGQCDDITVVAITRMAPSLYSGA